MGTKDVDLQLESVVSDRSSQFAEAWHVRMGNHPSVIHFDRPYDTLPISVTGQRCALDCAHCGGHYLEHMRPIWDVKADGHPSLLISGGCDPRGRVPVAQHLGRISELRGGRRLNWHVGFIESQEVAQIAPLVDVVSLDIVGDRATAREVYGLDASLDDYMQTLDLLRTRVRVVPHITIGLRGGRLSGEYAALEALRVRGIEALIFIVLIPTAGTRYAGCAPPTFHDVADVLLMARVALPSVRLYLGCIRPHGGYRQIVDDLAVRAGINGIVNPTRAAEQTAVAWGLEPIWGSECCALH